MKIILFANTDWYLYNFRLSLAKAIRGRGDEVLLVSPPGPYSSRLQEQDFNWSSLPLSRRGVNPLVEFLTIFRCTSLYRREQPDVVHHFTIKPVLYGSIAAHIVRTPVAVNSVTGLGYLYVSPVLLATLLRSAIAPFYRFALSRRGRVIFQNQNDRDQFVERKLVSIDRTVVIPGSGVDTERFVPSPEPGGVPVIMMGSRMLWDKGVGELVAAARRLKSGGVEAKIVLVGRSDEGNPAAIPVNQLRSWEREGIVEWQGHIDDMPGVLSRCHIVTLPSYGEGLPRALIEAAAAGKPIVATDVSGCREVVRHGQNGLLVPPKDPEALHDALLRLIENPGLRREMGESGRKLVVERFSDTLVNQQTLELYRELFCSSRPSHSAKRGENPNE